MTSTKVTKPRIVTQILLDVISRSLEERFRTVLGLGNPAERRIVFEKDGKFSKENSVIIRVIAKPNSGGHVLYIIQIQLFETPTEKMDDRFKLAIFGDCLQHGMALEIFNHSKAMPPGPLMGFLPEDLTATYDKLYRIDSRNKFVS